MLKNCFLCNFHRGIQTAFILLVLVILAAPNQVFAEEIQLQSQEVAVPYVSIALSDEKTLELDKTKINPETEGATKEVQDLKGTIQTVKEQPSRLKGWLTAPHMTGDMGGLRSRLEQHGVSYNVLYYNDNFKKGYGGLNHQSGIRYHGLVDMSASLNTEKAGLWHGGTFFIQAHSKHGHTLTQNILGDLQYYDNTDLPRTNLLSQYWYEQSLIDNHLKVKLGKQNACYDFVMLPSALNMLNVSQSLIPTVPIPAFPNPGLGAVVTVNPTNNISLRTGMFDGKPNAEHRSFKTTFDGKDGAVMIGEARITPSIKGHPGTYLAGYWYHNGNIDEVSPDTTSSRKFASSYGGYASFEQMLFKENSYNDGQGFLVSGQLGWAPNDRKIVSRYYGASLQYKGLIPKRNQDKAGVGMSMAKLSSRKKAIDGSTKETSMELFYTAQITPWLAIQPDMQFVLNPGGKGKDAMVFGLRTLINF